MNTYSDFIQKPIKTITALLLIFSVHTSIAQQFIKRDLATPVISKSNTVLCYGYFNNDGHLDFLANNNENTLNKDVTLLINDGLGNSTPFYIDLNNREVSKIKAGDIDGDGNDDLVVYEHDTEEIVWFKSQYLRFQEKKILSQGTATGYTPPLSLSDVNNDGYADLIYNTGFPTKIHFGSSSGLGNSKTIYNNKQENILIDYNSDGLMDFLYYTKNAIKIYIQNDNKTFSDTTIHTSATDYVYANLINIDSDPELELVRTKVSQEASTAGNTARYDLVYFDNNENGLDNVEQLLLNDIDQVESISSMHSNSLIGHKLMIETYERTKMGFSFKTFNYINTYHSIDAQLQHLKYFNQFEDYLNIEVLDLDADGLDEILWSSNDSGSIGYFDDDDKLRSATTPFLGIVDFTLVHDTTIGYHIPYIFDNDINANLHKLIIDDSGKYLLQNNNGLLNELSENYGALNSTHLNSDEKIDFVYKTLDGFFAMLSDESSYQKIQLDFGNSALSFIRFSDIESDGDQDILIGYSSAFQSGWIEEQLVLYKNNGNDSFEKSVIDDNVDVRSIAMIDVDGDGDEDIAINGYIYKNNNGSFTKTAVPNLNSKWELQSGDIDNDGDQDLVSVQKVEFSSNYVLYIHRQNSNGEFENQYAGHLPHLLGYESSREVKLVDLIDLDNDGDLDLSLIYDRNDYVNDQISSQFHWLENIDGSSFVAHLIDPSVELQKCEVSDLDNNGTLDILCLTKNGGLKGYFSTSQKSKINVFTFFDKNQNGTKESDENYYPDFQVAVNYENLTENNEDTGGKTYYVNPGSFNISYDESYNSNFKLTSINSIDIEIESNSDEKNIFFGVFNPSVETSFLQSISHGYPRCGKTIPVDLQLKNNGTETLNGEVELTIDPLVMQIGITDDLFLDQDDNILTYTVSDFHPGQQITKKITVKVPSIGDGIQLGDKIKFIIKSNLEAEEILTKTSVYSPEIRCSFDPNDKAAFPDRDDSFILFSEDILYNIRFQNTGNDTAYHINIVDTLSSSIDPTSFEILETSHREYLTTTQSGNVIQFRFDNIYLPDSNINEAKSHGYVSFKVNSKTGLSENTELYNNAHIYFDENPAIITNETRNILVSVISGVSNEEQRQNSINIFPNPTAGIVYYDTDNNNNIGAIELYDITGRLLHIYYNQNSTIDLSSFDQGMYLILWKNKENEIFQTDKIVLTK